jgi:hypothetical protein
LKISQSRSSPRLPIDTLPVPIPPSRKAARFASLLNVRWRFDELILPAFGFVTTTPGYGQKRWTKNAGEEDRSRGFIGTSMPRMAKETGCRGRIPGHPERKNEVLEARK